MIFIISIFIRTIIIYIILSIMLKIMGKRQIGELEVSELITTLLISEIGALPISDKDIPLIPSIIPILFIASAEVIISFWKNKSEAVKRIVEGDPVYIIYKGSLKQKALKENRISINEVLTEMRIQGIADISEVRYAILEQNGKLSFLKQSDSPNISNALIIDTKPDKASIRAAGVSEEWIEEKLREQHTHISEVFLMTVNESGDINIIKKDEST